MSKAAANIVAGDTAVRQGVTAACVGGAGCSTDAMPGHKRRPTFSSRGAFRGGRDVYTSSGSRTFRQPSTVFFLEQVLFFGAVCTRVARRRNLGASCAVGTHLSWQVPRDGIFHTRPRNAGICASNGWSRPAGAPTGSAWPAAPNLSRFSASTGRESRTLTIRSRSPVPYLQRSHWGRLRKVSGSRAPGNPCHDTKWGNGRVEGRRV